MIRKRERERKEKGREIKENEREKMKIANNMKYIINNNIDKLNMYLHIS